MRISSLFKLSTFSNYFRRSNVSNTDFVLNPLLSEFVRNNYPMSALGTIPIVRNNDVQNLTLVDETGAVLDLSSLDFEALSRNIFGVHSHYSLFDSSGSGTIEKLKKHVLRQIGYLDSVDFLENGFNSIDFDYINEFKTEGERRETRLKLFGDSNDVGRFKRYLQVYAYKVALAARLLCRQEAFRVLKSSKANERDLVTYAMTQTGSYGINEDHPFSKARKLALVAPPFLVTWLMDGQLSYCLLLNSISNNGSLTTEQNETKDELLSLQEWFGKTLDERANNVRKIEALLMLYGKLPHEDLDDVKYPYIGELKTIYADKFPDRLACLLNKLQDEVYDSCVSTMLQRHSKFERFPNENMQESLKDPDFQIDINPQEDKDSVLNPGLISTVDYEDPQAGKTNLETDSYEQPLDSSSLEQVATPEEVLDRAFKYALDLAKKAFEAECKAVTALELEVIDEKIQEDEKIKKEEGLKQKVRSSNKRSWAIGLGSAFVLATIGGKLAYDHNQSVYFESKVQGIEAKLLPYGSLNYDELHKEATRVLNVVSYTKQPVDYLDVRKWTSEQVNVRMNFRKGLNERCFTRLAVLFSPQGEFGLCTKEEWAREIRFFVGEKVLEPDLPNYQGLCSAFLETPSKYIRAKKDPSKVPTNPTDYELRVRDKTEQEQISRLLKQFNPTKEPTKEEVQPSNYINVDPNYLTVKRVHALMLERISNKIKELLSPYEKLNNLSNKLQEAKNENNLNKIEVLEQELNQLLRDLQSHPPPNEIRPRIENLILGQAILFELKDKIDERVNQIKSNNSYFANQRE